MGKSVTLYEFDYKKLCDKLLEEGADEAELLDLLLRSCGRVFGDTYVLLDNDYADYSGNMVGYNPFVALYSRLGNTFPALKEKKAVHAYLWDLGMESPATSVKYNSKDKKKWEPPEWKKAREAREKEEKERVELARLEAKYRGEKCQPQN